MLSPRDLVFRPDIGHKLYHRPRDLVFRPDIGHKLYHRPRDLVFRPDIGHKLYHHLQTAVSWASLIFQKIFPDAVKQLMKVNYSLYTWHYVSYTCTYNKARRYD